MTSLAEYQKKTALLKQLQEEVERIETDPGFKSQIEFVQRIDALLEEYGKDRNALAALLPPKASARLDNEDGRKGGNRKPSTLKVYKNPETGEVVKAKSLNQKTLRRWVDEYGKETVQEWAEQA